MFDFNRLIGRVAPAALLLLGAVSPMAAMANSVGVFNRTGHTVTVRQGHETSWFKGTQIDHFYGFQQASKNEVGKVYAPGSNHPTGFYSAQSSSQGITNQQGIQFSGGNYSGKVFSMSLEGIHEVGGTAGR